MRWWRVVAAVVVVVAGAVSTPTARAAGQWTPGAALGWARQFHAATTLADGSVLIVGGAGKEGERGAFAEALAATERYDPVTGRWTAAAPLLTPRAFASATTLRDGSVLVVGGRGAAVDDTARSAERYDPAANRWTAVASLREGRIEHTATLLPDGTVLVIGGGGHSGAGTTIAERYDLLTDRWTVTAPPLRERRKGQTATLLPNGKVLVTGGIPAPLPGCESGAACTAGATSAAELYDPAADRWTAVAPLPVAHAEHTATLLRDGRVLIVGGQTAEIYDPATDRWATTPERASAMLHFNHTATLLRDGTVLVVGGFVAGRPEGQTVERYDPVAARWTIVAPLTIGRVYHTATLLLGDRVLVAGGHGPIASTELFGDDGAPSVSCFTQTGQCLRGRFLQYWREHGGLAINGYPISDERVEKLEDGKEYTVQYFERVRLEYHPENAAPNDVLLGQFGRRIHPADPPVPRPSGPMVQDGYYFPETGHYVGGLFFNFWYTQGGLAQFGYPLSEAFTERLEDGKTYTVQYFERARLEAHPENPPPYDVLLGQFGRRILAEGVR